MPSFLPKILGFILVLVTVDSVLGAGPAPVLLGTAGNFAILTETGVSTVPNSAVGGDVGVSPATVTSLTGFSLVEDASGQFWTSTQVNGRLMGASDGLPTPGLLTTAVSDMQTAYTDASNRPNPDFVELKAGLIGGSILVPGLYQWATGVTISTDITIAGGPDDVWIFQISGTLVQADDVSITLLGGALSQNIFWAVADTVTVGSNGVFEGIILAQTNVIIATNAIDNGCIYAQTAVALQKATVLCSGATAVPPPVCSTSPTSTSTSIPATTTGSDQCTPTPSFTVAFQNLNASIQADGYLGYTLTDTVADCINFCSCLPGICAFVNPYHDNDAITKNSTMLTCAYYSECHAAADATNFGEQTGPDGNLGTVSSSDGYCLGC